MKTYMQEEARFRMLELRDPERYERLVAAATEAFAEQIGADAYAPDAASAVDVANGLL